MCESINYNLQYYRDQFIRRNQCELVGLNAEYNITVTSLVGLKVKELITDGGIVRLDLSDNNDGLLIIKIKDVNNTSNEYITKVIKVE